MTQQQRNETLQLLHEVKMNLEQRIANLREELKEYEDKLPEINKVIQNVEGVQPEMELEPDASGK